MGRRTEEASCYSRVGEWGDGGGGETGREGFVETTTCVQRPLSQPSCINKTRNKPFCIQMVFVDVIHVSLREE